jgi:hypothetical protein
METTTIFFDSEFTGLHQATTLLSIGFISEYGDTFYAEFNDADYTQVDQWLSENIISNLKFNGIEVHYDDSNPGAIVMKDNTLGIKNKLIEWFSRFDNIEFWSDCLSYDWVLFNSIFGGAFDIPEQILYIPFDICTLFSV